MLTANAPCRGARLNMARTIGLACACAAVMALAGCDNQSGATTSTAGSAQPAAATTASTQQQPTPTAAPKAQSTAPTAASGTQAPTLGDVPPIRLEPASIEFGYLQPSKNATGVINIHNTGNAPIKILSTKASCHCTTLDELAGKVIPPKESVPLHATLDTGMVPGIKKSSLTLVFEGYTRPLSVNIRGEVTLPIRVVPQFLNIVTRNEEGAQPPPLQGTVTIESIDQKPFRVLSADGREPQFVDFDPAIDEARSSYQLRWDLSESVKNCDTMRTFWCIVTDHPACPLVDARVRHECAVPRGTPGKGWRIEEPRLLLGHIRRGEPVDTTFTVTKLVGQQIHQVSPLTPGIEAELVSVEYSGEDASCRVRLTPKADLPNGLMYERINVYASSSYAELPVIGNLTDSPAVSSR
jgi:hypothetical protein